MTVRKWIGSREVLELLAEQRSDWAAYPGPEYYLGPFLRAGALTMRAGHAEYRKFRESRAEETDWLIPRELWQTANISLSFASDTLSGSAPSSQNGFVSINCLLLETNLSELMRAAGLAHPAEPSGADDGSRSSGRGRRREVERWEQFAAALAVMAHSGKAPDFEDRASLYAATAGLLASKGIDDPLDESSVRSLIDKFLEWYRAD